MESPESKIWFFIIPINKLINPQVCDVSFEVCLYRGKVLCWQAIVGKDARYRLLLLHRGQLYWVQRVYLRRQEGSLHRRVKVQNLWGLLLEQERREKCSSLRRKKAKMQMSTLWSTFFQVKCTSYHHISFLSDWKLNYLCWTQTHTGQSESVEAQNLQRRKKKNSCEQCNRNQKMYTTIQKFGISYLICIYSPYFCHKSVRSHF